MTYYPIPDIPDGADPAARRFAEQVRSAIARLETYGQPIEVHQPFYADAHFDTEPVTVLEFPVYRADVPTELVYATWTVPFNQSVRHDLIIRWRAGDGGATAEVLQQIIAASAVTTDWVRYKPKRFEQVTRGRKILNGQILTLSIDLQTEAGGTFKPCGLLSMYLRRAEAA